MKKINSTRKKGFTIVELVVAMAVIVIVSTTAISLVSFQNRNYLRTTQTLTATNMAENAIECFRWAVDNADGDVKGKFEVAYSKTLPDGTSLTGDGGTYTVEANGMTIEIKITSETTGEGDSAVTTYTLDFIATATEGEKVILQRSYTR